MSEKQLINSILLKLRTIPNSWWYKIPDPARCPKCGTIALVSKRPFDIVGCIAGEFVAIEVKVRSLKDVAPHQSAALQLVDRAEGTSIVIVGKSVYPGLNCFSAKTEILRMITDVL